MLKLKELNYVKNGYLILSFLWKVVVICINMNKLLYLKKVEYFVVVDCSFMKENL